MGSLSDNIVKYKKGELSQQEMHALEKKALVDPFLAEALEGVDDISAHELAEDVALLNKKIRNRQKRMLFTPLRIAAGIALVVGAAFLVYQLAPRPATIALQTEKPKEENKKTEGEKAAGNQPKEGSKKPVDAPGKPRVENQKFTVKSGGPQSAAKVEEQHTAKIQPEELKSEKAEAEIVAPTTQAPVQDLAGQQKAEIDNDKDQLAKEITGPEQNTASAKSISREKKKDAFVASEAQRSALRSAKIKMPTSISGHVVSFEDGSSLPGVNVIVKGTTIGTVTDSNGDFKISTDLENRSLVFSFIGLQSQEIDASNQDKVDVQMKDDVSQLSEVVVTALGTARDDQAEPVMKWAEPEGGRKAYEKYLESNVVYPEEALKNNIKGKSGIEFTVAMDGSLGDFRIFKKLGYGCEDELIRLVKEGPRWNPTTEDAKPIESTVRVKLRFPTKKGK